MTIESLLKEIEARAEAATKGPLQVVRFDNDGGEITYQLETQIGEKHKVCAWYTDLENPKAKADCTFAAHARTDIPRLVRMLRLAIEQRDRHANGHRSSDEYRRENAELLAIAKGERE